MRMNENVINNSWIMLQCKVREKVNEYWLNAQDKLNISISESLFWLFHCLFSFTFIHLFYILFNFFLFFPFLIYLRFKNNLFSNNYYFTCSQFTHHLFPYSNYEYSIMTIIVIPICIWYNMYTPLKVSVILSSHSKMYYHSWLNAQSVRKRNTCALDRIIHLTFMLLLIFMLNDFKI